VNYLQSILKSKRKQKSFLAQIEIPRCGLTGKRWLAKKCLKEHKHTLQFDTALIEEWYLEKLRAAPDVAPLPNKHKETEANHKILFTPEGETDKCYRAKFEIPENNFKSATWLAKSQLKNLDDSKTPHEAFINDWYLDIISTTSAERKAKANGGPS